MPTPPDKKKKKNKKPAEQTTADNFQMPAPAGAPPAAGSNQLDAALALPMPDISALLAQSGKQDMEKTNSLLNAGLIRGLKTDNYGDVQTGSRNPWKNGTFGTPEQVAQRANAGYEQRMKEIARPAGQYNIPRPVSLPQTNPTQSPPVNVPQPQARVDVFKQALENNYPALKNVQNMTEVAGAAPTVPSPTALVDTENALDPRFATPEQYAQVNNDPMVQRAQAAVDRGPAMLAQNAQEGANWTQFQNEMNNSLRNLDEIQNLASQPMGWMFGQPHDPNAEQRQTLERDMNNSFPGASPMTPAPANLFSQPGGNVLPFYIDTGVESLQKAMPGYDRFPWPQPPAGQPAPQNPAAVFPGATTPEKPLFDLSQMPGYMPPQPVGQSAQNWQQGAGQTLQNIYAGLFGQ